MADNRVDAVLDQYASREHLLPYNMTHPPVMSPEDVELYRGAAYGTPHEPWIKDPQSATAFQWSLHSPSAAYGLDFTRRFPISVDALSKAYGLPVLGLYDPSTDHVYSTEHDYNRGWSPGSVDAHEFSHRGQDPGRLAIDLLTQTSNHGAAMDAYRGLPERWMDRGVETWFSPDLSHRMMAAEERRLGSLGRTRLTAPSYHEKPDYEAEEGLDAVNKAIDIILRSRTPVMGPR